MWLYVPPNFIQFRSPNPGSPSPAPTSHGCHLTAKINAGDFAIPKKDMPILHSFVIYYTVFCCYDDL